MAWKYKLSFPAALYGVEGTPPGAGGTYGLWRSGVEQLNDIGKPVQPLPFTQRLISTNWMMHYVISMISSQWATDWLYSRRCMDVAIWRTGRGHEDVGRHVALDKLLGRRSKKGKAGSKVRCWFPAVPVMNGAKVGDVRRRDFVCGVCRDPLAVEVAERCNLTLVGFCKPVGRRFIPIRSV